MNVLIRNKRATYEYSIIDTYVAGIQLFGTEVKSLKSSKASINEAFCSFQNGEIFIKNMHIAEYANIRHTNHVPLRDRRLLLRKVEIARLFKASTQQGLTVIPLEIFVSSKGLIKVKIAVARGKKFFDKREAIKERDIQRQLNN